MAALEQAGRLDPASIATRRALAETHVNIGTRAAARQQWQEALASYRRALDDDGDCPRRSTAPGWP